MLWTGHLPHCLIYGWVFVLSNPAVLGYIVSSSQPISLQLGKKGELSGTGGKEAVRAHPLPPSCHSCHPSQEIPQECCQKGLVRKLLTVVGPLPLPLDKHLLPNSSHSSLSANKDVIVLASFFPRIQDALKSNIL